MKLDKLKKVLKNDAEGGKTLSTDDLRSIGGQMNATGCTFYTKEWPPKIYTHSSYVESV